MNSNRCLIGAWLAAVILMSGSLAVAQDSNATVIQDVYVLAHNPDTNYATQDLLRAGSPPEDFWKSFRERLRVTGTPRAPFRLCLGPTM